MSTARGYPDVLSCFNPPSGAFLGRRWEAAVGGVEAPVRASRRDGVRDDWQARPAAGGPEALSDDSPMVEAWRVLAQSPGPSRDDAAESPLSHDERAAGALPATGEPLAGSRHDAPEAWERRSAPAQSPAPSQDDELAPEAPPGSVLGPEARSTLG